MLQRLPPRVGYAIADVCGWVGFIAWPRGRRATVRNYRHVVAGNGAKGARLAARRSMQAYCRYLVDFARLPALHAADIGRLCEDAGAFERLREVLGEGRGAIIVPMHFGNWDIGAASAVVHGFDLTVVADRFRDRRLDALVFGAREKLGMKVVAREDIGPGLVRTLRRGGLVALLLDRPAPGAGVRVPFFGAEVEVPDGPARLALRTGVAIVPVAFPRLRKEEPAVGVVADFDIDTTATDDREGDITRVTAAAMACHERYIRCYPEQWYMFREMWPQGGAAR